MCRSQSAPTRSAVALPVTWHGAVVGLGRSLADHHLGRDMCPSLPFRPGSGNPQRPARAGAGNQLTLEGATAFDIDSLVDRLVADPHGLIIGEVHLQSVGDLLWTPRRHPPAVPTMRLVPALPRLRRRPRNWRPVRTADLAGQALLHVLAQPLVRNQLRRLGALGHQFRLPLRDRSAVVELAAASGCVATQLARDRRRRAAQSTSGLSDARALDPENRDLLPLPERQVATGQRSKIDRWHAATVAKPPAAHRLRHTDEPSSFFWE